MWTGRLGASLKALGIPHVAGVELNPRAAEDARSVLDEVVVADIDRDELPFEDSSFDCIVYGDVLEHLVDPWAALVRHRRLLDPAGAVILSIPNVGHWRTTSSTLRVAVGSTRRYRPLDATHLRFFTWRGIEQLLDQPATASNASRADRAWKQVVAAQLDHAPSARAFARVAFRRPRATGVR